MKASNIKQKVGVYNQIVNFFWAILCFAPVVYFCYCYMSLKILYLFIGISLPTMFIPTAFLHKIQLSHNTHIYHKIGIRFIKKYTQDGDLINKFIRSRYPAYKYVDNKQSFKKVVGRSYVNERFHYMVFVFFLLATIYAFIHGFIYDGIIMTASNIIFNVYPIFLQQYNRIRINALLKRPL
ncbi:hypothetical protein [Emticicia sp. 17c]|uniref:glycosyl-4,4'-diaponeurosporenoate acyltransferase CrtO family protein n=1 Tax=Emticicia sp. 17c TaxID=3127704 RepID=UPI00301DC1FC